MKQRKPIPNLDQVASEFQQWRSSRAKRGHTPPELMRKAIDLTQSYPVSEIVKRLKLNHAFVQRWSELAKAETPEPKFVPLAQIDSPENQAQTSDQIPVKLHLPSGASVETLMGFKQVMQLITTTASGDCA